MMQVASSLVSMTFHCAHEPTSNTASYRTDEIGELCESPVRDDSFGKRFACTLKGMTVMLCGVKTFHIGNRRGSQLLIVLYLTHLPTFVLFDAPSTRSRLNYHAQLLSCSCFCFSKQQTAKTCRCTLEQSSLPCLMAAGDNSSPSWVEHQEAQSTPQLSLLSCRIG